MANRNTLTERCIIPWTKENSQVHFAFGHSFGCHPQTILAPSPPCSSSLSNLYSGGGRRDQRSEYKGGFMPFPTPATMQPGTSSKRIQISTCLLLPLLCGQTTSNEQCLIHFYFLKTLPSQQLRSFIFIGAGAAIYSALY